MDDVGLDDGDSDDVGILGSESENDLMSNESSGITDGEREVQSGDDIDWVAATEEVLKSQGVDLAKPTEPVKVFTLCAGTDGPVKSLQQSLGEHCVDHFASCDNSDSCLSFVKANFAPRHYYRDVKSLLEPDAWCAICDGPCIAFLEDCADVMIAGRSRKFRVV